MKQIGEFVQDSESVEILQISYSKITDKGIEILSEYLVESTSLKELDLRYNKGITDASIPHLHEIAKRSSLVSLNVTNWTPLSSDKMFEVYEALSTPIEERDILMKKATKHIEKRLEKNSKKESRKQKQKLYSYLLSPENDRCFIEEEVNTMVSNQVTPITENLLKMKMDIISDTLVYEAGVGVEKFIRAWNSIDSTADRAMFHKSRQMLDELAIHHENIEKLEKDIVQNAQSISGEELKEKGVKRDKLRNKLIDDFDNVKSSVKKWSEIVQTKFNGEEWKKLMYFVETISKAKYNLKSRAEYLYQLEQQILPVLESYQSIYEPQRSEHWLVDGNEIIQNVMRMMNGMNTLANNIFKSMVVLNHLIDENVIDVEKKANELLHRKQILEDEIKKVEEDLTRQDKLMQTQIMKHNKRKQIEQLENAIESKDEEITSLELRVNEIKVDMTKRKKSLSQLEREKLELQVKEADEKIKLLRLDYVDLIDELSNLCNDENGKNSFPDLAVSLLAQTTSSTVLSSLSSSSSTTSMYDLIKIPRTLKMKSTRCYLLETIGDGGFSSVFKVKLRNHLDKYNDLAAFKQFGVSTNVVNRNEIEMIEREIEMLQYLANDNIVKIIGAIGDPDAKDMNGERMGIGILMEYCDNGSLRSLLNKNSNQLMNMDLIIHLLFGAAQGLEYLHNHIPHAIIHGDIKSDNILIDKEYNAKLCDFGISKLQQSTIASTRGGGNMGGTTAYKAPETFDDDLKLDTKSDVYSFGCVILEMLTGERPWASLGHNPMKIMHKVINMKEQHDISKARNDTKEELIDLMRKCLDYDKDKRPTMNEVRMELEKMMNNAILIDIISATDEYKKVENMFFPGGDKEGSLNRDNYRIVKIEKVINRFAERLYIAESQKIKSMMLQANAAAAITSNSSSSEFGWINERLLFHGTSKADPMKILNHPDAFMKDYSREGFYGRGLYFAELARYSNKGYRYDIPNADQHQILVCSVICGRSKEYGINVDDETRRLSHKELGAEYHSVHAGPHRPIFKGSDDDDSCMYIVYKDTQVVAKYLITYEDARRNQND